MFLEGPDSAIGYAVYFKENPDGTWSVFNGVGHSCGSRVADQWYQADFVIDWACKMVDVWIDGELGQSNIAFYQATTTSFDKIHVYNWDETTARDEEIVFSSPPISRGVRAHSVRRVGTP